jgi:hypothetical protein
MEGVQINEVNLLIQQSCLRAHPARRCSSHISLPAPSQYPSFITLRSRAKRRVYLDGNPFAAVFTFHHMLDDGIAGEHLIHARYAVEREAYTEELEDLVEEEPVLFVRLIPLWRIREVPISHSDSTIVSCLLEGVVTQSIGIVVIWSSTQDGELPFHVAVYAGD